jgi:Poxvirus A32 protein
MYLSNIKAPGLEVKEIKINKSSQKKHFECNPLLPQPPFLLLMAAPRYSGKTNLLINMLINEEMYCHKFDEIFIWSKSFHNDPKWEKIQFPEEYKKTHVFHSYNEAQAQKLFENIQKRSEKEFVQTLFVFDDMMGDDILKAGKIQMLDRIAATGRHFDLSAIIIFQKFKKFSPTVRENATNVVVFEQKNSTAIEQLAEEYKGDMSRADFLRIYQIATEEPFSFLHINLQVDQNQRFRKNWTTIIHQPARLNLPY